MSVCLSLRSSGSSFVSLSLSLTHTHFILWHLSLTHTMSPFLTPHPSSLPPCELLAVSTCKTFEHRRVLSARYQWTMSTSSHVVTRTAPRDTSSAITRRLPWCTPGHPHHPGRELVTGDSPLRSGLTPSINLGRQSGLEYPSPRMPKTVAGSGISMGSVLGFAKKRVMFIMLLKSFSF